MTALSTNFARQVGAFALLLPLTHQNPKAKNVHKLRVATRRLRAWLWLLRQEGAPHGGKKLSHSLRRLGRKLGTHRELEILREDAKAHGAHFKGSSKILKAATAAIARATTKKEATRILNSLIKLTGPLGEITSTAHARGKLRKRLKKWESTELDEKNFHPFRITLKKIRYVLEACGEEINGLAEMQDSLGRAHDLQMLSETAGPLPGIRKAQRRAIRAAALRKNVVVKAAEKLLRG